MTNQSFPPALKNAIEAAKNLELPLGIYVLDHAGKIVYRNEKFEELLGPGTQNRHMVELYVDASDRDSLDEEMKQAQAREQPFLEGITLHLRSADGQREVFVKDFTRLLADENGQWVGMKCCLFDITEEQKAQRLFEQLPVGVYLLDAQNRLVFGNDQLARFHGYERFEEIENRHVSEFFVDNRVGALLGEEVQQEGEVRNRRIRLKGSDGRPFWGSITARRLVDEDGGYAGREGVVVDVTREELYRQLIEELPIGLFRVRREVDGSEVFEHYNPALATITGYDQPGELLGSPISILHESEESYREFRDQVDALAQDGEHLGPMHLRIQTKDPDTVKTIEVTTRTILDDRGRPVLRVGTGHDITDEAELREWDQLIRRDFGSTLHTLTSNLMSFKHTLEVAREPLGDDPFESPSSANLDDNMVIVDQMAQNLGTAIADLLAARDSAHAEGALDAPSWAQLEQAQSFLAGDLSKLPPGLRHATSREVARKVANLFDGWATGHVSREKERPVRHQAGELARVGTLLSLHMAEARLIEMDAENQRLREVVISANSEPEPRARLTMGRLVRQALDDHAEYARRQGVETRFDPPQVLALKVVEVEERAMRRAIGNLIHNAIKYSWHRPGGVYANLYLFQKNHHLGLRIRNYGVPVARDELDEIFKVGFRGRYSGDRRRRGTGIGLWDALRVARRHGGTVTLESRPASGATRDYKRPHLTTVEMLLALPDSAQEG